MRRSLFRRHPDFTTTAMSHQDPLGIVMVLEDAISHRDSDTNERVFGALGATATTVSS